MGNTPTKAAQTGSSTAETKQDQKQTTTQTITQEAKDQLKTACYTGNIKKIEELIAQYSANILKEKLDTNGSNALIHAAVGGHNNTIDHLLSKGLSLDFTNNNGTNALIYAALNGHNNTIDHLLSKGLSLDLQIIMALTLLFMLL